MKRPFPSEKVHDLDKIDRAILHHLQLDASISNTELAARVSLSPTPCLRRVRRLEAGGYVTRYAAVLDQDAVGLKVNVFALIRLERNNDANARQFEAAIRAFPEVMECYLVLGPFDYLLRIVAADLQAYERFLKERLAAIPAVADINSTIALSQISHRTELPIDAAASQ